MRRIMTVTALLLWALAAPFALAQAAEWEWTPSPEEGSGKRSCWMSIRVGDARLVISGSTERLFIGVGAAELAGLETGEEGTLHIGGAYSQLLNFVGNENGDYGTYFAKITESELEEIIIYIFLLNPAPDIFVTVGPSGELAFPGAGVKDAAEGLNDCLKQL